MNGHEKILGVEGGGTKTAWVLVERDGADMRVVKQGKLPPSNFRLATPERLARFFPSCRKKLIARGFFWRVVGRKKSTRALTSLCRNLAERENHHRQR